MDVGAWGVDLVRVELTRLDQVLEEAVDLHQRSDVPYGMFLSGGIDSAVILAMMARLPCVERFAWFADRVANEYKLGSIFDPFASRLTTMGEIYRDEA